ncbi:unknown [Clostridium sp. CAG:465]|mgnify:FL=1|nr:unknown [Clostridium sp. CAG:465]
MYDRSDDYPYSNIMELLSDYNNSKFELKGNGLFRKKYKLVIKRRDD